MQAWINHFADSGVMIDTYPCSNNGQTYSTSWIPSQGAWLAHHGMSLDDFEANSIVYATKGFTRTNWWNCGPVYTAIWRK